MFRLSASVLVCLVGLFVVASVIEVRAQPAGSAESRGPTRRDLYQYVWDFVLVGDGAATGRDLQDIAAYYSGLAPDTRVKVDHVFANGALSSREKKQEILGLCQGLRHGTVVSASGEEHRGVLHFNCPSEGRILSSNSLHVTLTKGGTSDLPLLDVVEIDATQEKLVRMRTNRGQIIEASKITLPARGSYYYLYIDIHREAGTPVHLRFPSEIKKILLGRLERTQCGECFRTMEIDWRFCPYCGTRLQRGEKPAQ